MRSVTYRQLPRRSLHPGLPPSATYPNAAPIVCSAWVAPALCPAGGRPDTPHFQAFLPWFLRAKPSAGCAKGGQGAYSDALAHEHPPQALSQPSQPRTQKALSLAVTPPPAHAAVGAEDAETVAGLSEGVVQASAFRTLNTPLNEQHVSGVCVHDSRAHPLGWPGCSVSLWCLLMPSQAQSLACTAYLEDCLFHPFEPCIRQQHD